jgi:hypothetical protein
MKKRPNYVCPLGKIAITLQSTHPQLQKHKTFVAPKILKDLKHSKQ